MSINVGCMVLKDNVLKLKIYTESFLSLSSMNILYYELSNITNMNKIFLLRYMNSLYQVNDCPN